MDDPLLRVLPIDPSDRPWLEQLVIEQWGACEVVTRGVTHRADQLPGCIAWLDARRSGAVPWRIAEAGFELVTLNSLVPDQGIGTALLQAAIDAAQGMGCMRVWLITTNDNLRAVRFYQKRGMALCALHRNAIARSRELKPGIPLVGIDGIALRDELELELILR